MPPSVHRGHLVDMEQETRRELESLQRERELLQAKEKDNLDAIDEVRCEGKARLLASGSGPPVPQRGWFIRSGSSGLCDLVCADGETLLRQPVSRFEIGLFSRKCYTCACPAASSLLGRFGSIPLRHPRLCSKGGKHGGGLPIHRTTEPPSFRATVPSTLVVSCASPRQRRQIGAAADHGAGRSLPPRDGRRRE